MNSNVFKTGCSLAEAVTLEAEAKSGVGIFGDSLTVVDT
jgi:hypothetical protein